MLEYWLNDQQGNYSVGIPSNVGNLASQLARYEKEGGTLW